MSTTAVCAKGAVGAACATLLLGCAAAAPAAREPAPRESPRAAAQVVDHPDGHCLAGEGDAVQAEPSGVSSRVTNGRAYDCAALEIRGFDRIVLPDNAIVMEGPRPGVVLLEARKSLHFVGHPPETMTPRLARENMGCAWRIDGGALVIGNYGEWDSHIEGGAWMDLRVVVPRGLRVSFGDWLSGELSTAADPRPSRTPSQSWYGPRGPAPGWSAVRWQPDPVSARLPDDTWDPPQDSRTTPLRARLRECANAACRSNPGLRGRITLEFAVDAGGVIRQTHLAEDTVGSEDFERCIQDVFGQARLPGTLWSRGTLVRLPLVVERCPSPSDAGVRDDVRPLQR